MKITPLAFTSKLITLLGGIIDLLTKVYTSTGAATLQLKQLRDSPAAAKPGENVGGLVVKATADENHETDGEVTRKLAIGIYGDSLDTIGSLVRKPTAALSAVQESYYGAPNNAAQLYRTVTAVSTDAANSAFKKTLNAAGKTTAKETFQAALKASEDLSDDVGLPLGTSSVGLLNAASEEIERSQAAFNAQINSNKVKDGSVLANLAGIDDPANNTELDSKADLFGSSTVPTTDMRNVPQRMILKTFEEMEAIIRASTREITEVVVHHTDTYEDQDVNYDVVREWHVGDRGWSDVGYHFLILRNGDLQVARPISKKGAHVLKKHNKYSIGISFCGGIVGSHRKSGRSRSSSTFQPEQWKTFDTFMRAFYTVHPGGQSWGHNDIDPQRRSDPNFDVVRYVKKRFGKENVQTAEESRKTGALSIDEIIARQ